MKRSSLRRTTGAAAAVLALTLSLAACGDDADEPSSGSDDTSSEAPMDDGGDEAEAAGAQTFGEGCAAIPTSGKGSFDGMVTDPVATAASNNPLLSTLVTAVGEAGLGDTLNGAEALTVFAPTNDAFAALPEADLAAVLADKDLLTSILTYHVVGEQLDPTAVVGAQTTLQGAELTVEGDTDGMTVQGANIICGNIPTGNATVYVIDTVMMPPA
jgi:uncharacterized surface protein with fasciclin (FAS1) repeats